MPRATWPADRPFVPPMLASAADAPLTSAALVYEPKYDGIRALALVDPGPLPSVTLWSRLGRDKTAQFPGIVSTLQHWGRHLERPVLLDGEIVAIDRDGQPLGFERLQPLINRRATPALTSSSCFVAFDVLRDGDHDLRPLPLSDRRAVLETLLASESGPTFVLAEQVSGDGRGLHTRAVELGLEGVIAKRRDSPYLSGKRTPEWRKLKVDRRASAVVAGWTEPRGSRRHFGSLVLGLFNAGDSLLHVGHVGTGFDEPELARLATLLASRHATQCPFPARPETPTPAHWVTPTLVAEIRYTEWTDEGRLRHPTYLGLRDDVPASSVTLASEHHPHASTAAATPGGVRDTNRRTRHRVSSPGHAVVVSKNDVTALETALTRLEADADGGLLQLPDGHSLAVTHLRKVLWPDRGLTKGDLLRHYVRVSPFMLPALADRPLVMKRYPDGVLAQPFYQHRAPHRAPAGIRIETAATPDGARPHVVGGDLCTLLYTAQLASVSQDPWASRIGHEHAADYVTFDLDPPDGVAFQQVLDVARWLRDELETLGATPCVKTSGSRGVHLYVRLQPATPFEACLLFAQIVSTVVAGRHAKVATVERSIPKRRGRVYVDAMQNARGKTLASAYSARATTWAGVSTPVSWAEVEHGVTPGDFTIETTAARLRAVGDIWAALATSDPVDLHAVSRYERG